MADKPAPAAVLAVLRRMTREHRESLVQQASRTRQLERVLASQTPRVTLAAEPMLGRSAAQRFLSEAVSELAFVSQCMEGTAQMLRGIEERYIKFAEEDRRRGAQLVLMAEDMVE